MRFALSPDQKKFFVRHGYIAFEDLPQKEKELAQLVYELSDNKPLRIVQKKVLPIFPEVPTPFDYDTDCALLLSLKYNWGIFFTFGFPKISKLYEEHDGEFLYLVFTKRYLDPERHPVVYS